MQEHSENGAVGGGKGAGGGGGGVLYVKRKFSWIGHTLSDAATRTIRQALTLNPYEESRGDQPPADIDALRRLR